MSYSISINLKISSENQPFNTNFRSFKAIQIASRKIESSIFYELHNKNAFSGRLEICFIVRRS